MLLVLLVNVGTSTRLMELATFGDEHRLKIYEQGENVSLDELITSHGVAEWDAPWRDFYQAANSGPGHAHKGYSESKDTESAESIQTIWNTKFLKTLTSEHWSLVDTHKRDTTNVENRLGTQDCLMVHKNCGDHPALVGVGLLIEFVSQKNGAFPDKTHKAKFIRDMLRVSIHHQLPLFGIITDLFQAQVLKLNSVGTSSEDLQVNLQRSEIGYGPSVKQYFCRMANCTPRELGVKPKHLKFTFENAGDRIIDLRLGSGSQGTCR